mmetsp:Transcript_29298/g.75211  ORF Transcript_29298/g.75211 Transcript_29298/m.75211 type:complete len:250 (-) Transcript_29298:1393-2142(-)
MRRQEGRPQYTEPCSHDCPSSAGTEGRQLAGLNKDRRRECRHHQLARLHRGARHHWVAGRGLQGVQFKSAGVLQGVLHRLGPGVEGHHHTGELVAQLRQRRKAGGHVLLLAAPALVHHLHHDEARQLLAPRVGEPHALHDLAGGAQAQQRRGAADAQQLLELLGGCQDLRLTGFALRVRQHAAHVVPLLRVLARGGQAHAQVVRLPSEVQPVEPVARVVGVAIEGLGAEQLVAGMEEGDAMRERHQRGA